MTGAELYDRVINWPTQQGLTAMFGVAVALIVIAAVLLSIGRSRWFARAIGILGVLTIMVAMFVIHEQKIQEQQSEFLTVTRPRYPEATRFQIRVALVGLPTAAAIVMSVVFVSSQRRLRSTIPGHLKEGRRLLFQGSHDAALEAFNKAIQIAPYLGEAYYQRGNVYAAKGETDQALADFDQAVKCDPQLTAAYLHRARIRTERGDLDAALADFDHVMSMRPNDIECYLNRGICLVKKGIVGDAIQDFQRVLKLTNHSDYAEPAKQYLSQLTGTAKAQLPEFGGDGSAQAAAPNATGTDYVV